MKYVQALATSQEQLEGLAAARYMEQQQVPVVYQWY
jgi:hypothetical protein